VHQSQRLPLGFETGDDLFRVHAEFDDLKRHAAADRFFLFSHIHDPAAAFADLLEQFVAIDVIAARFPRRRELVPTYMSLSRSSLESLQGWSIGWLLEKSARSFVRLKQCSDAAVQFDI